MRVVPFLSKLFLLLTTTTLKGHGIFSFIALFFVEVDDWSNARICFFIATILCYVLSLSILMLGSVGGPEMRKRSRLISLVGDVLAYICFIGIAYPLGINPAILGITSLPFVCCIGYVVGKRMLKQNNILQ